MNVKYNSGLQWNNAFRSGLTPFDPPSTAVSEEVSVSSVSALCQLQSAIAVGQKALPKYKEF